MALTVKRDSMLVITLSAAKDGKGNAVTSANASAWLTIVDTVTGLTVLNQASMPWASADAAWEYTAAAALFTPYRSLEIIAQLYDVTGLSGTLLDSETAQLKVGP
jgi:hypothetical protein